MKTKIWYTLGGLLLATGSGYALWGFFTPQVAVKTAPAKSGAICQFIDEQAKTRLHRTHLITMPIAGRIEEIKKEEGTIVKKDEVVARLFPDDLKWAVDQAEAVVERLKASLVENDYVEVEKTAGRQADEFVTSTKRAVEAAAERVKSGKAKLDYSNHDLARVKRLAATGARTQDDLEKAELDNIQSDVDYVQDKLIHAAMEAIFAATNLMPKMVEQYIYRKRLSGPVLEKEKAEAEARLSQVRRDRDRGTMRSPVDGVVLNRFITDERYLAAGTSLLEIGSLDDMEVEADVLSLDVVAAKVGDKAEVYGPAIGLPRAKAVVTRIYPAGFTKVSSLGVEQQRVKVILRFEKGELERLLRDRRLGVGYHVRVQIFTDDRERAVIVPRSALFCAADDSWQLVVVRNGRARLQTVKVGLMNDREVEIVEGLSEGEPVILAPESSLTDGARVYVGRN
jgi:HlyD family secretion protein